MQPQNNVVSVSVLPAATESPAHAATCAAPPAVKTPAGVQIAPVTTANTSGIVLLTASDGNDASASATTQTLLEELHRRKTHNVRSPIVPSRD
jgi:hypothetical protein